MERSFAGKIKEMGRGVGQGKNSPCCLHALGLGQGTVKPPQGPVPRVLLKKAMAPLRPHPGHGTGVTSRENSEPTQATLLGRPKATPNVSAAHLSSHQEPCPQPTLWKRARGMKDGWDNADPRAACGSREEWGWILGSSSYWSSVGQSRGPAETSHQQPLIEGKGSFCIYFV